MPVTKKLLKRRDPLLEHSRVKVLHDFARKGVTAGETGTIVHVYEDGGYEVEFLAGRNRPVIVTVETKDVEAPRLVSAHPNS